MKLDFLSGVAGRPRVPAIHYRVESETDRLTDVMLCRPSYLAPVPCCSVTEESLRHGFRTSIPDAVAQHEALQTALERHGVRCHVVPADPALPDMCFTRDVMLGSPWGVIPLRPATSHRRAEAAAALNFCANLGIEPALRLTRGTIEGGDICIVRPGLVIIGWSGERTNLAGAEELAQVFRGKGWDTHLYPFDRHFLHLDTQFCMVGPNLALACTDVLEDGFLKQLGDLGVDLIPVGYKDARRLACNVLSLGDGRILSSSTHERINAGLVERGFTVERLDIEQFAACGGGVHCLTMPLRRQR